VKFKSQDLGKFREALLLKVVSGHVGDLGVQNAADGITPLATFNIIIKEREKKHHVRQGRFSLLMEEKLCFQLYSSFPPV
jgi:hypothetical protein